MSEVPARVPLLPLLPPAPSREWLDTVSYRHCPHPWADPVSVEEADAPPLRLPCLPAVLVTQLRLAVETCGVTAAASTVVVDLRTGAITAC